MDPPNTPSPTFKRSSFPSFTVHFHATKTLTSLPHSLPIMDIQETHHHHQPSSPATATTHHHHQFPKQDMFEKQLTPSDVGKLNRLVIPKQHAEKYFPIDGGAGEHQKGLVLSFEDESGKLWRFRYSYWNSSQSYVLTKGWSRYVKDKRLDAGDVVLFQRHFFDCERMFIGWRRRFVVVPEAVAAAGVAAQPVGGYDEPTNGNYLTNHLPLGLSLPYQPDSLHAVEVYENMDNNTCQRGVVSTRRLRLFGVNLECQDSEPSDPYGSTQDQHQYNFSSDHLHPNMMR